MQHLFLLSLLPLLCRCQRPSPSDLLPVQGLSEPEGSLYDPPPDGPSPAPLLGDAFDPAFMSAERPTDNDGPPPTAPSPPRRGRLGGPRLRAVNLGGGLRVRIKMDRETKRRFRELIWLQSQCPLEHRWRDLGPRFWPRWFREASCARRPSCSFPRGMRCRPYRSESRPLLRWHCRRWHTKEGCGWIKVQYPLVAECRCAC